MGRYWRSSSTVPLAIVALTCATFAVYLFSILWQGHWKYHELLPWLSLAAIGGIISLVIIAFILRQGLAAVSRLTALLIMLCSTSAAGIFYGVLANCHLSCGSRIISEVPNRTGKVKAVWFSRKCVAWPNTVHHFPMSRLSRGMKHCPTRRAKPSRLTFTMA